MHIAKRNFKKSKGVIVLTHKEYNFLERTFVFRKKNIPKLVFFPFFMLRRMIFSLFMKRLAKDFILGIHWGARSSVEKTPSWVSFHMSAPGTAEINDGKFIIPMNSANFISNEMTCKSYPKIWDVVMIAKNIKVKNIDLFFRVIKEIYEKGRRLKVILIVASNKTEPKNKFYSNILSDYNEMFSDDEREDFVLIKTHPETGFKGLSTKFLSDVLNLTKVFTLFSQSEGESRVIKEAQMCGLPVVCKSDLTGGGRDYLDDKNSVMFDSYENAKEALIYAVDNYQSLGGKRNLLENKLSENKTVEELETQLIKLFEELNEDYRGGMVNTDHLDRRLPSHYVGEGVFWAKTSEYRFRTTDVADVFSLIRFLRGLRENYVAR